MALLASCRQSDSSFASRLRDFDVKLAMGDAAGAASAIAGADGGESASRLGSILKREYRLSLMTGDSGRYARAAVKAAKASGSPAMRALAAQALLENGRGDEARMLPGDASAMPEKFRAALGLDETAALGPAGALAKGADFWAGLAKDAKESGYSLNAALSALSRGEKARAALELRTAMDPGYAPPPEVAFDCGLYEECLELIAGKAGASVRDKPYAVLAASAKYLLGDSKGARAGWEAIIEADPLSSSSAFRNLAATEEDQEKRRALLERAVTLFPADAERRLDLVSFYAGLGMREEGLAAIEGLPKTEPEALIERLALDSIHAEGAQVEASALMAAAGRPESDEIARWAFFKLLGLKRREAAFRLLLDAERRAGEEGIEAPWMAFGKACLLAAQGRDGEAVEAFDACSSQAVHYASLWNAAILLSGMGDQAEARKRLAAAIAIGKGREEKARAYVFLGNCHLKQAQREPARTAYLAALSLWPECPEAGLALAGLAEKTE